MKIESAKQIWETEYKPSIQLLIDNGEASYRPATLLMFCAIEHAYRAIEGIETEDPCIQQAIRWAMPYYSTEELQKQADIRIVSAHEWNKINVGIEADVGSIRSGVFNELKHVGVEKDGISIDGGKFGFMSGWPNAANVPEGASSKYFTIHIIGFWDMVVDKLDDEYARKTNHDLESHEPE